MERRRLAGKLAPASSSDTSLFESLNLYAKLLSTCYVCIKLVDCTMSSCRQDAGGPVLRTLLLQVRGCYIRPFCLGCGRWLADVRNGTRGWGSHKGCPIGINFRNSKRKIHHFVLDTLAGSDAFRRCSDHIQPLKRSLQTMKTPFHALTWCAWAATRTTST
jgi:hypothetical protein